MYLGKVNLFYVSVFFMPILRKLIGTIELYRRICSNQG